MLATAAIVVRPLGRLLLVGAAALLAGCSGDLISNVAEPRRGGDVTVVIINDTPFRAAFTVGAYSKWLRNPPGPITLQQFLIEPFGQSEPLEISCQRHLALGTEDMIERAVATEADQDLIDSDDGFDVQAFSPFINFSSAPADSELASAPTAGQAAGLEVELGVDFTCVDEVIFFLQEDPSDPTGFTVTFRTAVSPPAPPAPPGSITASPQ